MKSCLLLTPGLLCDTRLWQSQIDSWAGIAQADVPDLAACDTIAAMADAVLARAPSHFALAGFSLGGVVALEILARNPRRVTGLALVSTDAAGITPVVREHLAASIAGLEAGHLDAYLKDAFPRYVAPSRVDDRALWETFSAMANHLGAAAGARQMRALLDYPGFRGDLARIACPTVVIAGRDDQRIPVAVQQQMAAQIPGATFRVIENAGHFTPLEQPAAVSGALREWLASIGPGASRG
jgi:pimeloyl-ACP methyl ester carboxylesterase